MPEMLSAVLVLEQLGKLRNAFPNTRDNRSPAAVAELYREHLAGVSADALRAAVTRVIREDEFFPKVSRLRGVAFEVEAARERERRAHDVSSVREDEQLCPNCRQRYYARNNYAPRMDRDEHGRLYPATMIVDEVVYVLLEPRARIVCDCSSPSHWTPVEHLTPLCAPASTLFKYHLDALKRATPRPPVRMPALPETVGAELVPA
jgi:hypothetical protein